MTKYDWAALTVIVVGETIHLIGGLWIVRRR